MYWKWWRSGEIWTNRDKDWSRGSNGGDDRRRDRCGGTRMYGVGE